MYLCACKLHDICYALICFLLIYYVAFTDILFTLHNNPKAKITLISIYYVYFTVNAPCSNCSNAIVT